MEEKWRGRYERRKKRRKTVIILLLSGAVLFGGRNIWKTVLIAQAEHAAETGREKLPAIFGWAFRHYYPAGTLAEKEESRKEDSRNEGGKWLDWLWDSIPLYRQGNKSREITLGEGEKDPAYKNYMDSKQFSSEYEALLGWGGEDTQAGEEDGWKEEQTALAEKETEEGKPGENQEQQTGTEASAALPAKNGVSYSREQLADYDFMMNRFFSVHPSTTAGRDIMDAGTFLDKDFKLATGPDQPQILIYHTHSQETFADYGPENMDANVVGLGVYLTELLEAKGYYVIHDTSQYDIKGGKLDRSKAYTYALEGITEILQENPSIQVVLDIHRDGVDEDYHMVSEVNGKATAPIMFFLGMSRTPKEAIEYLPNPNLESNLAFSFQMQLKAAEYFPGLTRKIYLKGLRYNLHLRPCSSLIEVGAQNNTYQEAKNAMEPLAEVLDMVLQGK